MVLRSIKAISEIKSLQGKYFEEELSLERALGLAKGATKVLKQNMRLYSYDQDEEKYKKNMDEVYSYIYKAQSQMGVSEWQNYKDEEESWAFYTSLSNVWFLANVGIQSEGQELKVALLLASNHVDYTDVKSSVIKRFYIQKVESSC